jgi:hypothetical protein
MRLYNQMYVEILRLLIDYKDSDKYWLTQQEIQLINSNDEN